MSTNPVSKIGTAIRSAADGAGLSQKALAKKISKSPQMLSAVVRGKANPSITLLNDIAAACGCKLVISFTKININEKD